MDVAENCSQDRLERTMTSADKTAATRPRGAEAGTERVDERLDLRERLVGDYADYTRSFIAVRDEVDLRPLTM
jgi:hypothetical protein